ncbi:MAG: co-chaperone GroES [Bradymonadaceae bacterium]
MNVEPLEDRVLLKRKESEERTDAGIIVPESAQEKPQKAVVEAVGPGKTNAKGERVTPEVSEGDTVLFGKYSGTDINIAGEDHIIMRESEILAILDE